MTNMKWLYHSISAYNPKAITYLLLYILFALSSCSINKKIAAQADHILLSDQSISQGHIGISMYEPASGRYWYNYNADKYFIPASNTKLFTLYAGLKHLGDSITGIRYSIKGDSTILYPAGDPTFLHPAFPRQPVMQFLLTQKKIAYCTQMFTDGYGKGWAWDDYLAPFMPQCSEMPIYGNIARVYKLEETFKIIPSAITLHTPPYKIDIKDYELGLYRNWDRNDVFLSVASAKPTDKKVYEIPFIPEQPALLSDTLHKDLELVFNAAADSLDFNDNRLMKIYSQPADSLFKFMMHQSDNLFAEQTLLMVSNEMLGYMNTGKIIDSLIAADLQDLPQKPRWVDGSGLSRYNLFTPKSFIYILNKMKNEFGIEKLKKILPTGGEGTLKNYFITESSFIYAKSGTLSNNSALSGFMITKKGKLLVFSVLTNHYQSSATPVRRAVERFINTIREQF